MSTEETKDSNFADISLSTINVNEKPTADLENASPEAASTEQPVVAGNDLDQAKSYAIFSYFNDKKKSFYASKVRRNILWFIFRFTSY